MCPSLSVNIWADTIITRRWRHGIPCPRSGAGGDTDRWCWRWWGGHHTHHTTHWRLAPPWPPHRHHSVCPHPRWGPEHGDHADHRVTRDTWTWARDTSRHNTQPQQCHTLQAVLCWVGPWAALGWKLGRLQPVTAPSPSAEWGNKYSGFGVSRWAEHISSCIVIPTRSIQFCFVESSTSQMISRPSARPHCNAAASSKCYWKSPAWRHGSLSVFLEHFTCAWEDNSWTEMVESASHELLMVPLNYLNVTWFWYFQCLSNFDSSWCSRFQKSKIPDYVW